MYVYAMCSPGMFLGSGRPGTSDRLTICLQQDVCLLVSSIAQYINMKANGGVQIVHKGPSYIDIIYFLKKTSEVKFVVSAVLQNKALRKHS